MANRLLWAAIIASAAAGVVALEGSTISFDEGYSQLFGDGNLIRSADGRSVRLKLDRYSGSGFISSDCYQHGFFSASIKLPSDHTAGVVVAFYRNLITTRVPRKLDGIVGAVWSFSMNPLLCVLEISSPSGRARRKPFVPNLLFVWEDNGKLATEGATLSDRRGCFLCYTLCLDTPSIKKPQSEPLFPSDHLAPPIKKPKSLLVGTDLKRFMDESVINMSDLLQSKDLMQLTYQDQLYQHQERFML